MSSLRHSMPTKASGAGGSCPPLLGDRHTFDLLAGGVEAFGGGLVRQSLQSVVPFARQLFRRQGGRQPPPLRRTGDEYRSPDPVDLVSGRASGWWPPRGGAVRWAEVELAVVSTPAALGDLSPGELVRLPDGMRRHEWLLGRAALKALLGIGDTSSVAFPNRSVSLTHSAGVAIAARCDGPQAGLGVDLEGWQTIDPRTARLYLHPHEQGDLLRLWTVKEALFKATPANDGAVFLDYEVDDAQALGGVARDHHGRTFEYLSRRRPEGWLTLAMSFDEATVPLTDDEH